MRDIVTLRPEGKGLFQFFQEAMEPRRLARFFGGGVSCAVNEVLAPILDRVQRGKVEPEDALSGIRDHVAAVMATH